MHSTTIAQRNPLEIAELAAFDSHITDLDPAEQQRRRVVYLQQALTKIGYGRSILKSFGCFLIPLLIIPLFWPFIILFYFIIRHNKSLMDNYVVSACHYWDIPIDSPALSHLLASS